VAVITSENFIEIHSVYSYEAKEVADVGTGNRDNGQTSGHSENITASPVHSLQRHKRSMLSAVISKNCKVPRAFLGNVHTLTTNYHTFPQTECVK